MAILDMLSVFYEYSTVDWLWLFVGQNYASRIRGIQELTDVGISQSYHLIISNSLEESSVSDFLFDFNLRGYRSKQII